MVTSRPVEVRLAELVAALSLGTDLGLGQPMEHVIRQTLIALRMSELLGLEESERTVVYYAGLLAWVGCHTDAYEQAKWFGDDLAVKADGFLVDEPGPAWVLSHLGAGKPPLERARLGAAGAKGEEIRLTSRLVFLADVVAVFHRLGGLDAAVAVARERSGTAFDPALVDLFCSRAGELLGDLEPASNWDEVIAAEPQLELLVSEERLDDELEAIGDFADMKSPFTIGHSLAVADLAARAGRSYGLGEAEASTVRRAGLLHDIGRLGVSNAVWDKRGSLSQAETERVRLHPYLTERMLAFSPTLAKLGAIAVQHHERLDGSGYPRQLSGDAITPAGRVLGAAGHRVRRRRAWPAG